MNRREFLASVAALGGVAFGPTGSDPDPEIPVVLLWKWRMAAENKRAEKVRWSKFRELPPARRDA